MSTPVDLSELAAEANRELEGASALQIMTWAHEQFGLGLVVTSSLADTVMIHLAEQVAPGIDVIFLDTGYHFVETIGTRDAVEAVHNVNLISSPPSRRVAEQDAAGARTCSDQPRPVLRDAQGRPARQGAEAATRPGPPACAGPTRRPAPRPRSSPGTPAAG